MANIIYANNLKKILNENLTYYNYIYCHKCSKPQEILEINYDCTEKDNLNTINSYFITCSICKLNWNAILTKKCNKCNNINVFYTRRNMLISGCVCACDYRQQR